VWRLRFDSHGAAYDDGYEGQVSTDVETEEGERDGMPWRAQVSLGPYSAVILSQDD
jgi:1,4-alpha-glucan branching enzyme